MDDVTISKYNKLLSDIASYGALAIAFSGGVDSSLLLFAAKRALGSNVLAISATSPLFPESELESAKSFCMQFDIRHVIVRFDCFNVQGFAANPPDRCYICKKALMGNILNCAHDMGFMTLAEGTNADDSSDYRPGMRAVAQLGIISPLKDAGLEKRQIREILRNEGLAIHNKPSYACLASRFAYGQEITLENLKRVEAAEDILHGLGMTESRVRVHRDGATVLARIEVAKDRIADVTDAKNIGIIQQGFRALGFCYVTVDLGGYVTGSMNRGLLS